MVEIEKPRITCFDSATKQDVVISIAVDPSPFVCASVVSYSLRPCGP